jgi:hypothetical protein
MLEEEQGLDPPSGKLLNLGWRLKRSALIEYSFDYRSARIFVILLENPIALITSR